MLAKIKSIVEVVFLSIIVLGIGLFGYAVSKYFHPPITAIATSHDVNKLSPVVRLTNKAGRTYCSGVVVSPHTVITALHCVLEDVMLGMPIWRDEIYIRGVDGTGDGVLATVSSSQPQLDEATVTGDFSTYESRKVITSIPKLIDQAQSGAVFISCGYPLGGSLYCGRLTYVGRINFMWLMKGTLLPGMSGGPTMLEDGTVIAINDAVQDDFSIISPTWNTPVNP